jgi:hypothetical protein
LWTVVFPFAKNKRASLEDPENGRQLHETYLSKFISLRKGVSKDTRPCFHASQQSTFPFLKCCFAGRRRD